MKRFLDKTWTKVAAFILFFVFLGLSIAGGVGIYFLAANDVYLAGSEASRKIRQIIVTQILQAAKRACCLCIAGGKPFGDL